MIRSRSSGRDSLSLFPSADLVSRSRTPLPAGVASRSWRSMSPFAGPFLPFLPGSLRLSNTAFSCERRLNHDARAKRAPPHGQTAARQLQRVVLPLQNCAAVSS
jgi:hypothetical protein